MGMSQMNISPAGGPYDGLYQRPRDATRLAQANGGKGEAGELPEERFLDREESWLRFNERVLELAEDESVPLLDRVRFLAIFANNLDEFLMVRVAGLVRRMVAGFPVEGPGVRLPRQVLENTLELAGGTAVMNPEDIPEGSNTVIEKLIGPEVRAIDEIYVRMPTPDETRRLKLSTGTPVAVHYCTGYTQDERVVRVEYFVIPGDRHVIVYEREHPQAAEG